MPPSSPSAPDYATVLGILEDWRTARGLLEKAAAKPGNAVSRPLSRTKLLAPVQRPSSIFCAGANYADHAAEMNARHGKPPDPDPHTLGLQSWHFLKATRSISNPGATVKVSDYSKQMDWEAELAAVIGRPAKHVPMDKALSYVAGYTVANDLSARDRGRRPHIADTSPFKADWVAHKSFDGSCPLGPGSCRRAISRTRRTLPSSCGSMADQAGFQCVQDDLDLAEQIAHLSSRLTLHPGDLILTGTPAGVGAGRDEYMKAGDVVKVSIEKIGDITTKIA